MSLANPILTSSQRSIPLSLQLQQSPPSIISTTSAKPRAVALAGPGSVIRIPLDNSAPDAYQIIPVINELAEQYARMPEIREFVVRLIGSTGNHDQAMQLFTVLNWVKDNLTYTSDPIWSEYVIAPDRLIEQIVVDHRAWGDCEDHVLLLNSMLGSVGFMTRSCGVKLYTQDRFDHIISQVWYEGDWKDVDPCAKLTQQPEYLEKLI